MSRTSLLLLTATMGLVVGHARQAAEAAPVTLGHDAYDELASVELPKESSSRPTGEKTPPKATPQPKPQKALLPTTSTGSSPSTVSSSGSAPSAIASPAVMYQPPQPTYVGSSRSRVYVSPRFLDGIFRPPRLVVSF